MKILVLNCGSSSIKYQVIAMKSPTENTLLGKGIIERIGLPDAILTHKPVGKPVYEAVRDIPDHTVGISLILEALVNPEHGVLESISEIAAVGHRVTHGGEFFKESTLITKDVKKKVEACFDLAPLHNPANMKGILAMEHILPNVPQVAVFDTSFHQTVPPKNYMYALPYKYYEQYRVRRYGFHGTSHKFVAQEACKLTGTDFAHSKIITCHIGSGASVTAIMDGKSFDTSMGFTPVDGLIMGTRCGNTDPGALIYIAEKEGLNLNRLSIMINKESGMLGITDLSSDMRDVRAAASSGNARAQLALEMFWTRIKKFVGSYAAQMGGVDLIVFTGGIGENDFKTREQVCEGLEFMGVKFDTKLNKEVNGRDLLLSTPDSKVKVAVVATNEELVIATDTFRITQPCTE
ncbi:MAG: acetate kinase [Alistipes sp.]|nr:acetate kinase [Alistipes sp.]